MLDSVEPIVLPNDQVCSCPGCNHDFMPKRSNQRYCSRACQRNAARGNRTKENAVRSYRHYERAARLSEFIYSIAPRERLGRMKDLLELAVTDSGLRNILTDPELLNHPPRADNRMNIAKAANAYVRKFYGLSIQSFVRAIQCGRNPEGVPLR